MCHTHFSFLSLFINSLKLIIYHWRGKEKKKQKAHYKPLAQICQSYSFS